jgi:hypothetical protein
MDSNHRFELYWNVEVRVLGDLAQEMKHKGWCADVLQRLCWSAWNERLVSPKGSVSVEPRFEALKELLVIPTTRLNVALDHSWARKYSRLLTLDVWGVVEDLRVTDRGLEAGKMLPSSTYGQENLGRQIFPHSRFFVLGPEFDIFRHLLGYVVT